MTVLPWQASWATYNTVRYFLSYGRHPSDQTSVALALGASSSLSLVLLMTSASISLLHAPLIAYLDTSNRSLQVTRIVMRNFSSLFLLIPPIVNIVLVFMWRSSPYPEIRVAGRCHFEIDVVWSFPASQCDGPRAVSWKVWLAASIVRLALTVMILVSFFRDLSTR
jgi:hypothetical protein